MMYGERNRQKKGRMLTLFISALWRNTLAWSV